MAGLGAFLYGLRIVGGLALVGTRMDVILNHCMVGRVGIIAKFWAVESGAQDSTHNVLITGELGYGFRGNGERARL